MKTKNKLRGGKSLYRLWLESEIKDYSLRNQEESSRRKNEQENNKKFV